MKDKQQPQPKIIPHQQKALRILTDIQNINNKYILLARPKIEEEISDLLEKYKGDQETIALLVKLLKAPGASNSLNYEKNKIPDSMEKIFQSELNKFFNANSNQLILMSSETGELYRKSNKEHCYPMKIGGDRYEIVKLLAKRKGLVPSREIMDIVDCKSYETLTSAISEINKCARKSLDLSNKQNLIISKKPNGYKINDPYLIIPKK